MLSKIFILLTLSVIYFFFPLGIKAETNFIPNPSFELSDGVNPLGWMKMRGIWCQQNGPIPMESFIWTDEKALGGNKAVGLNIPQALHGSYELSWLSKPFTIDNNNQELELTFNYLGFSSNINLAPALVMCTYDQNGSMVNDNSSLLRTWSSTPATNQIWKESKRRFLIDGFHLKFHSTISIGLGNACADIAQKCSGNLWFDNISLIPIYRVKAHAYYDSNQNNLQELPRDWPLWQWEMKLFKGKGCSGEPIDTGLTDMNGNISLTSYNPGEHSVLEIPKSKFYSPSLACQNVILSPGQLPFVDFANFLQPLPPPFPYFSQKDPAWGNNEYDSASVYGPFFCGTTMAGCGCATTSAAMLLKYYGVDKDPSGNPTNPGTLNTWLKNNGGYIKGALSWHAIGVYSQKANAVHGTQKIKYSGSIGTNNFNLLTSDLNKGSPVILEEPRHFLVATSKQGDTYNINDPYWENRKTLASYSNNFLGMRRYEKTSSDYSALQISTSSPSEVFIIDSLKRRAGKDPSTGIVYTEIPNSFYTLEPTIDSDETPPNPPENSGVQTLLLINPGQDSYNFQVYGTGDISLTVSSYDRNGEISIKEFMDIESGGNPVSFETQYSPEPGSVAETYRKVDIDYFPFNRKNILKLNKNYLPIAILGSDNFDVKDIIVESLIVAKEGKPMKNKRFFWDVNRDKIKDMIFFFNPQLSGISSSDTTLCLKGAMIDGTKFKGCDNITIRTKSRPKYWDDDY